MLTDAACKAATCPPDKARARFPDAGGLYLPFKKKLKVKPMLYPSPPRPLRCFKACNQLQDMAAMFSLVSEVMTAQSATTL